MANSNYITYNLYLDSVIDYNKLETLKILNIKENLPLSSKLIEYIKSNNIKFIEFSSNYSNSIDNLPSCVEHIFFQPNSVFNKPLKNLPYKLKTLILGDGYWETLDYLPSSLTYLGYHKSIYEFIRRYDTAINIDTIIINLPPKLLYLSIPKELKDRINIPNTVYNNKIFKVSEEFPKKFLDLIMEKHNQDYFASCII
jgi:hypothetical protein